MNLLNLIGGIILVSASTIYFLYVVKRARKDERYDYWILSSDIKVVVGIVAFFLSGLFLIYKEVKELL